MSLIYCLYATDDRRPRYIGQTTKAIEVRLAQHIAEARRGSATAVGTWIRVRLEAGFQIRAHILQAAVAPGDLSLFERYWMRQFTDLLNADAGVPLVPDHSPVARAVVAFLAPNSDR
jgi:hypothetical protein